MRQVIGWSTLFAILMLLFACANMGVPRKELETARVVVVHQTPGLEVNSVAGTDYFKALQGAIERQDRARMLSAGFTPEQADTLLDPAQSGAFLAPYLEAAKGRVIAIKDGELCRVWISGGVKRVKPELVVEACSKL
jgi:hypothetical protein